MKFFTANYSQTNHNFVIQNLHGQRIDNEYLPAICILKNILQRGRPTLMSKYLQEKLGAINKDDFKEPYTFISNDFPVWNHTIKGDETNNYFPAKTFFEKVIKEELPEFEFITRLIRPETPINEITQQPDERFKHQQVDFYLPQASLVVEIDGQQHKTKDIQRLSDTERDNHLQRHQVKTIRISTKDLGNKSPAFYNKIIEIESRLQESKIKKALDYYKSSFENELEDKILKKKMLPTAIIRFQVLILEMLEYDLIQLTDKKWNFNIVNHELTGYEKYAIKDLFIWFEHLLKLQKTPFNAPSYNIGTKSKTSSIRIDFSLLKRWTDENELQPDTIFVRTDYFDIYYDRITETNQRVNHFKLSTTNPVDYKFIKEGEDNDLVNLEFFLKNLYGYESFKDGQYQIIENALSFRDTIGLLPTGGGKSLTYQLAALLQPCISFMVCPIKSLMYDQKQDLENAYIQNTESITSDVTGNAREQILNNYANGKYFFVFISPERFQTQDFRDRLLAINSAYHFSYAVIDEVHCLSEWGHDFRTSYLNLSKTIRKHCKGARFLGLTATASVNVLKDIQIEFNINQVDVKTLIDYTRPELEFIVVNDGGNKYEKLSEIIQNKALKDDIFTTKEDDTKCGLIFTPYANNWYGSFGITNNLRNDFGADIRFYSGSKPREYAYKLPFDDYKVKVQKDFKNNKFSLLVATKAFGMGINKKNIDYTIHYGIPSSMESLYQEAGRAGRNGQASECYVLLSEDSENALNMVFQESVTYEELKNIQETIKFDGQDVIRQLLLFLGGLEPIEREFDILKRFYTRLASPGEKKLINGNDIQGTRQSIEKAIYRLSNLGIVNDWTIENFFGSGVFTVYFEDYSEDKLLNNLLHFIRKYEDDFDFDTKDVHQKYKQIKERSDLNLFDKAALILLHWSYDHFANNRRESLKNVYQNSLEYEDSPKGRERFKNLLEAYFKFTESTYVLQHISEHNNKDFEKWFEVFYDVNNNFIKHEKQIDLEGNLQRFIESYQYNTGLNLINALVILLLNKSLSRGYSERLIRALDEIALYDSKDYDYIIDQVLGVAKYFTSENKLKLAAYLYQICRSNDEISYIAKELGDISTALDFMNNELKEIIKRFENGFRQVEYNN